MSFSSLILSLCRVHGRERPVWSCGVVEWIGRPLISPTPSPGHRQVTRTRCTTEPLGTSRVSADLNFIFKRPEGVFVSMMTFTASSTVCHTKRQQRVGTLNGNLAVICIK